MATIKIYGIIESTEDSCYDEFHTTEDGAKLAISKRKPQKWPSGYDRYTWDELELIVDDASLMPRRIVADALAVLRADLNAEVAYCQQNREFSDYDEGVQYGLTQLDATIAALGLAPKGDEGEVDG